MPGTQRQYFLNHLKHKAMNTITKQNIEDTYKVDSIKACRMALKQTTNLQGEERLQAINNLLHGYGTEAIRGEWQNGYWCDVVACYVNMGDTYNTTVIQVRSDYGNNSTFKVSTFGDFVERNGKKYGIY